MTLSVCGQAVRGLLENRNEPINELSYFDCIESVMENSKVQSFSGIIHYIPFVIMFSIIGSSGSNLYFVSKNLRSLERQWQAFLSTVRQAMS